MRTNRLVLFVGCLFMVVTLGGWIHGTPTPTFEGKTWKEALAKVPCSDAAKDGKDVKITGVLIVDGKSTADPVLTKEDEIEPFDKKCFSKH